MPSAMHKLLSLADRGTSAALGLRLIPQWRLPGLPQSEYLKRVFQEWEISAVIDVGANLGQYRDFLRNEVEFSGPILSVEPIPELAQGLTNRAVSDANWRIVEAALGESAGNGTFNITAASDFSSLLTPGDFSRSHFAKATEVNRRIDVKIETLDWIIDRNRRFLGSSVYLKLDTQGFDLQILGGLKTESNSIVAAQTEASVIGLYDGAPNFVQSIETFTNRGFTVSGIFPLNVGHFPRLIEFDCHFVKILNDADTAPAGG
jgi:FkbM family methyltransferase